MEIAHDLIDIEPMPCVQFSANYILWLHQTSMHVSKTDCCQGTPRHPLSTTFPLLKEVESEGV
jgi:hypothetical protein